MAAMNAIEQLRKCMKTFPQGVVTNRTYVEQLLADCWDELQSDDGGMKANKLVGRTKDLTWAPPHLTFKIERHGGMVLGSKRAERQEWTINLETLTCTVSAGGYRQHYPNQPSLDVKPLAAEAANLITEGRDDPRLSWYDDGSVRVHIGKIIPDGGPKQTVVGRRKRFWNELDLLLATDWRRDRTKYRRLDSS